MQITHWQMEPQEGAVEVSAEIDGFRLWYRVPNPMPCPEPRTLSDGRVAARDGQGRAPGDRPKPAGFSQAPEQCHEGAGKPPLLESSLKEDSDLRADRPGSRPCRTERGCSGRWADWSHWCASRAWVGSKR